jgi:ABC-type transport system involved in multi-copper enzyme maturation permease subunit
MSLLVTLTRNEVDKLRRQVILRAVGIAQIIAPAFLIVIMRLVTSDIGSLIEPGSVVVATTVLLAGVASITLVAPAFGQEYELGTGRSLLMRGVPRSALVAAKAIAVLILVNLLGWIALAVGFAAACIAGWRPEAADIGRAAAQGVVLLPLGCVVYLGVSGLGCILFRSTASGLLLGLAVFLGGFLLSTLRVHTPISDWSPVGNLLVSLGGVFAEVAGVAPSVGATEAAIRVLGISLALLVSAGILYARQDQVG